MCQEGKIGWEILEHPPYSPYLSPCDFNLFVLQWLHGRPKSFYDAEKRLWSYQSDRKDVFVEEQRGEGERAMYVEKYCMFELKISLMIQTNEAEIMIINIFPIKIAA